MTQSDEELSHFIPLKTRRPTTEIEKLTNRTIDAVNLSAHALECFIRVSLTEVSCFEHVYIPAHDGQRIANLMCDACGELADHGQTLCSHQLLLSMLKVIVSRL